MKSAEKKPKEAPVKWIDTNRKILIASLLNFSNGPISNLNNSKAGWNNVVADFHEKTGLSYNKEKLTHQVSTMKKTTLSSTSSSITAASVSTREEQ